ncbi:MAG: YhbY family RNA-binding protein [Verrucomicrobia bacterium]|nr:YhbY family RNA-binding protein [Verrucomicrobiota bacterium]
MSKLSGPQLRALKARAQRLEPILRIGKAGLSDAFFAALETALDQHELVKLKFEAFKDQKKGLTPQLVERSRSQLILRVGNVAVLYRRRPHPAADDATAANPS